MGKFALILIAGGIVTFGISNFRMNEILNDASRSSYSYYNSNVAKNIANSVAHMLLSRVADSTTYRATTSVPVSNIFNGSASYKVKDTTLDGKDYILIDVIAKAGTQTKKVKVFANQVNGGFIPPTVKAAISTNNKVSTLGTLNVDGRDHDKNGNLISNSGTLGIWSTNTISQSGSSDIGGTVSGVDKAPAKPASAGVISANQTYSGGYPNSPDSILGGAAKGFPAGKLKQIAQSGYNGSQYTTNPAWLTYPLKSVTYVELPSGGIWNSSNIDGSGILIIHNSTGDAVIKNENLGTFRGLIIADDIIHIHTTIIGAIISLTPSPSGGNSIGNGSGDVLFSRQAIIDGIGEVVTEEKFGFASHRLNIAHWFD
ncbi:MAG: hypothetical protein FD143_2408 [Ignavibacteria bacterium]|nr:MAG: hypothetical protein FD143_2408 [Ignavibacteria bacterium]KAF0157173.1 MAG: hypothetical protein FD188_2814 [Ignavibacteria bacterium]